MRLHGTPTGAFSLEELQALTHINTRSLERSVSDLVTDGFARMIDREGTAAVQYGARTTAERADVDALAQMYHQRPVSLVKLVYEQPSPPLRSFSDAFRLRRDDD